MRLPRVRFTVRRVVVLAWVGALALIWLLCSTYGPFRSVSGRGVDAHEANARLWHCLVPDQANDVWFTSGYRGTRVECTIDPRGFLSWCERRGWSPTPIREGTPVLIYSIREGRTEEISHGLRFQEMDGDFGNHGVYDVLKFRAYVIYSGG